jgi:hypothetical protein
MILAATGLADLTLGAVAVGSLASGWCLRDGRLLFSYTLALLVLAIILGAP